MTADQIRAVATAIRTRRDFRGLDAVRADTGNATKKAKADVEAAVKDPHVSVGRRELRHGHHKGVGLSKCPSPLCACSDWRQRPTQWRSLLTDKALPLRERLCNYRAEREADRIARALAMIHPSLKAAYKACNYRVAQSSWAGGNHVLRLALGSPSASGHTNRVWSDNRKWSGNDSMHVITVPETWLSIPEPARVVGGLLTLEISPISHDAGPSGTVRPAVWVEQSRGVAIVAKRGFLAQRADSTYVHADTATGAVKALRPVVAPKPPIDLRSLTPNELLARARVRPDASICRSDARIAGHCDAGIRDWCAKHGVDRECVTALDLATLAVTSGDRVREVYAVLLASRRAARHKENVHVEG